MEIPLLYRQPMLRQALSAFAGEAVLLTLDTSLLWDRFCLVEVCFVWGGRSFTLAQTKRYTSACPCPFSKRCRRVIHLGGAPPLA